MFSQESESGRRIDARGKNVAGTTTAQGVRARIDHGSNGGAQSAGQIFHRLPNGLQHQGILVGGRDHLAQHFPFRGKGRRTWIARIAGGAEVGQGGTFGIGRRDEIG